MFTVSFIAIPDCLASSISLPLEMLNAADNYNRSKNRAKNGLVINIASLGSELVETSGGLTLKTNCHLDDIQESTLIILPSLWRDPLKTIRKYPTIVPWLQRMAKQDATICAVGTSSCFLAEAGLLNHKPATTHWYFCEQFAKYYPEVDLKPKYLITQADNLYCAGSVNSVADLMVHLIDRHYGHDIAQLVEGQFSPEIRRSFSSHAYDEYASNVHQDELIIQAQEWLQAHALEELHINDLAHSLGLSMRTFNRRFKQATTTTASHYLQNLRINTAKELLRTSNLAIAEVAEQSGYQDSSYFCARFKKVTGQTPLAYRKTVRGKLFKVTV